MPKWLVIVINCLSMDFDGSFGFVKFEGWKISMDEFYLIWTFDISIDECNLI